MVLLRDSADNSVSSDGALSESPGSYKWTGDKATPEQGSGHFENEKPFLANGGIHNNVEGCSHTNDKDNSHSWVHNGSKSQFLGQELYSHYPDEDQNFQDQGKIQKSQNLDEQQSSPDLGEIEKSQNLSEDQKCSHPEEELKHQEKDDQFEKTVDDTASTPNAEDDKDVDEEHVNEIDEKNKIEENIDDNNENGEEGLDLLSDCDDSMFQDDNTISGHDDDDENEDEQPKYVYPKDSGYAWVIMIAAFVLQFLLLGYLKSLGIFFVEFQAKFNASSSTTSLVVGLHEASGSVGSWIAMGVLLKRMSVRTVTFAGCFFMTLSVAVSSIASSMEVLFLTQGIMFGIAAALLYGPSFYILSEYFEKRRAIATAIATCGTSLGGVAMPQLIRYLLNEYALEGGMLLTAGILAQSFIFSTLLTPIEQLKRRSGGNNNFSEKDDEGPTALEKLKLRFRSSDVYGGKNQSRSTSRLSNSRGSINQKSNQFLANGKYEPKKILAPGQFSSKLEICEEGVPLKIEQNIVLDSNGELVGIPIGNDTTSSLGSQESIANSVKRSESNLPESVVINGFHLHVPGSTRSVTCMRQESIASDQMTSLIDVESIVFSEIDESRPVAFRQHLSRSTVSLFCSTSTLHTNFADIISVTLPPNKDQDDVSTKSFFDKFCLTLKCKENILLRSFSFWVLTVYFFCACIGQAVPQIFIPALAKERGLTDEDAAMFISIMNLLDIPARIVAGLLVNCGVVRVTRICIIPMTIVGIVGHLTPFFNSYESLLTMVILYGLFIGVYFAMQSLMVIEVLGMEHFASAIGFYYLMMGLGGSISYPIAGALKDMTGTYSSSYHYLATMQLVSVAQLLIIPFARRSDTRRGILKFPLPEQNLNVPTVEEK